jgi:RNA polymerase sigma-70 factor (ECF subfamily)
MHSQVFKEQVLSLQDNLYRLAYSMLHNREEAEDVVQETLIKLWSRRETLDELDNVKFYSLKITKNHCLDRIKLRKPIVGEIEKIKIPSSSCSPQESLEIKNMVATVNEIIKLLPEQQRIVVHLRNIEELSMEEIASVTEMSINNIRVTLSRARKSINEIYQKHFNHE